MSFFNPRIATLVVACMAAAASFAGAAGGVFVPRESSRVAREERRSTVSIGGSGRGPGWSHAHVQRMARKRRNVRRNRTAHRGQRGLTVLELLCAIALVATLALACFGIKAAASDQPLIPWTVKSELRCIYGYRFVVDEGGRTLQLVDDSGKAVRCHLPHS